MDLKQKTKIFELIGGYHVIIGILAIITSIVLPRFEIDLMEVSICFCLIFFGLKFLKKREIGFWGLLLFNLLQLLNFRTELHLYSFHFDISFFLDIQNNAISFVLKDLIEGFPILINKPPTCGHWSSFYFAINLIALLMIFFLIKTYCRFFIQRLLPWELGFHAKKNN